MFALSEKDKLKKNKTVFEKQRNDLNSRLSRYKFNDDEADWMNRQVNILDNALIEINSKLDKLVVKR